ncbi:MAG TPA: GNAT family protein [Thermoanaerobaculia bacterium]|jgi:RimJ/RimL family protein N-acetyltransferase|nr:GNAT family protein [Thermoanaerobaculia bacterium]
MIELQQFTPADIDRLIGWIPSLEALQLWTASSFDYPLTREHLEGHLRQSAERGDRLIFKAVAAGDDKVVGHVELGAIDRRNRSLRIGRVLLDPATRGHGLGVGMMRSALSVAFDTLQVHRVELGVFDVNPRAIACYERVGFRQEGMRRESYQVRGAPGSYWSEIFMSVLSSEWKQSHPKGESDSEEG